MTRGWVRAVVNDLKSPWANRSHGANISVSTSDLCRKSSFVLKLSSHEVPLDVSHQVQVKTPHVLVRGLRPNRPFAPEVNCLPRGSQR
jgi:hypothetical protein